jgi:hypothetical protein
MRAWRLIAAAAMLPLGVIAAPSAQGATKPPHITATPNNAMVNTDVTLVGRRFAPNHKLRLKVCNATGWIAPQDPCSKGAIHVMTNGRGRFTTTWRAALCPRAAWPGHPVTEERCYIGKPKPEGVDTITLVGHVKVIVTYP